MCTNLFTTNYKDGMICTTYYLSLEVLSDQEKVSQYIINPLIKMYREEFKEADKMVEGVAIGLDDILK